MRRKGDMTNKPRTCSFCFALKGNNRRKLVLEIELKKVGPFQRSIMPPNTFGEQQMEKNGG